MTFKFKECLLRTLSTNESLKWAESWTNECHGQQTEGDLKRCRKYQSCPFSLCCSVQSLSRVQLFVTPWTAARQASLTITSSPSLFKLVAIESMMPSTMLSSVVPFSSCRQSFPASGSFPMSQFFASGGQSIGVSGSASVPPVNTQDWSPLGWTGWISLQSKGLSRVFSSTTCVSSS